MFLTFIDIRSERIPEFEGLIEELGNFSQKVC